MNLVFYRCREEGKQKSLIQFLDIWLYASLNPFLYPSVERRAIISRGSKSGSKKE